MAQIPTWQQQSLPSGQGTIPEQQPDDAVSKMWGQVASQFQNVSTNYLDLLANEKAKTDAMAFVEAKSYIQTWGDNFKLQEQGNPDYAGMGDRFNTSYDDFSTKTLASISDPQVKAAVAKYFMAFKPTLIGGLQQLQVQKMKVAQQASFDASYNNIVNTQTVWTPKNVEKALGDLQYTCNASASILGADKMQQKLQEGQHQISKNEALYDLALS